MNSVLVVENVTRGYFFKDHNTALKLSQKKTQCTFSILQITYIIIIGVGKKLLITILFIRNSIYKCPLNMTKCSHNNSKVEFCRMCQIPTKQTNNKHNIRSGYC